MHVECNDSVFFLAFVCFFLIEKKILTYNREQLDAREDGKEGEKERERNAIYPQNKYEYRARFSIFFLSFSYRFFARQRRFSRWQIRSSTAIVTFFFPFFFFLSWSGTPFRSEDLRYFYPRPPSRPSVLFYFFSSFASFFVLHER